jgi:hypothetical protein
VKPTEFKLPPHGNSKDEDFDPTVHFELEPERNPDDDGEDGDEAAGENDDVISFDSEGNPKRKKEKVFKLVVPNLY